MGLSDFERIVGLLDDFAIMRSRLMLLKKSAKCNKKEVARWIQEIDFIAGTLIVKQESNDAYWLLGENENNVRSLYTNFWHLKGSTFTRQTKRDMDRIHLYTTMPSFVNFLVDVSEDDRRNLRTIGAFWHMWQMVGGCCYRAFRYDDGLFSNITEKFYRLLGCMFSSRHSFFQCDVEDVAHMENVLLCKYQIFLWWHEKNVDYKNGTDKIIDALREKSREIGSMTPGMVEELYKKHLDENDCCKAKTQEEKKKQERADKSLGFWGNEPRDAELLLKVVKNKKLPYAERMAATEEFRREYGGLVALEPEKKGNSKDSKK